MAKFFGEIGFETLNETSPGVWTPDITERNYSGDLIKSTRRWDSDDKINGDININNTLSILSDPYASENIYQMRYVVWMGSKWKITSVEVQFPRLLLSLGGVYTHE